MNEQEYYSIRIDGNEEFGRGPFTYIDEDLLNDETGQAFDLFIPDPSLRKARALVAQRRKKLPDHFFITCASWFLISQKAWEVFQKVRCCESIRWIPTQIHNKKNGEFRDTFQLAYEGTPNDIWDYSRSDFYWYPGKTPGTSEAAGYMRRGIIDLQAMPKDKDFFRAKREEQWIGTRRLCELIREHELTGFGFKKLQTNVDPALATDGQHWFGLSDDKL